MTTSLSLDDSVSPSLGSNACEEPREADVYKQSHATLHVIPRPSQASSKEDRLSQASSKELFVSQGLWQRSKTVSQEVSGDGQEITSTQMSSEIYHTGCSPSLLEEKETVGRRWQQTEKESEAERNQERTEQMCSRHGKKMKSILQECSEELDGEPVQAECTPTSPTHSASPHQDSSSTNISASYIQEVSSNHQSVSASKSSENHVTPSPTPSVLTSPSPSLLQSPSPLKSTSMQRNTQRINAGETEPVLATVVLNGHDVKLSLESQSFLMRSRLLQPQVCLYRLNMEERDGDSCSDVSEEEAYAFFDTNTLYSDTYSESDSADSDDPDYDPNGR